jgi:hypothetical protein
MKRGGHPAALNNLANVWLMGDSAERDRITAASGRIEEQLKIDSYSWSESREGEHRIMFAGSLAVTFHVIDDGRTVQVLNLWKLPKRRPE